MEESKKQLMPDTPVPRPPYLPVKQQNFSTPVAIYTQNVDQLRSHLGEYTGKPPDSLLNLLKNCSGEPLKRIQNTLNEMNSKFCAEFKTNAEERFKLAESLYYRLLENILRNEMNEKKGNIEKVHDF